MHVIIPQSVVDYCGRYSLDIRRFADFVREYPRFDEVHFETSWGLLVCKWFRKNQVSKTSLFLDVLQLTDGEVIDDNTGEFVHRWRRVAQQLVDDADKKAVSSLLYVP